MVHIILLISIIFEFPKSCKISGSLEISSSMLINEIVKHVSMILACLFKVSGKKFRLFRLLRSRQTHNGLSFVILGSVLEVVNSCSSRSGCKSFRIPVNSGRSFLLIYLFRTRTTSFGQSSR